MVCTFKVSRVYVQNVSVCIGTTRTCVSTCGRGAGTHGDVSNVHTETSLDGHTGVLQRFTPQHKTQHTKTWKEDGERRQRETREDDRQEKMKDETKDKRR